jgi:serine/threonine-protein kinase
MAPEIVLRQPLSQATDVYGLGALLYELLTGRWAYEDVYQEEVRKSGLERQFPQIEGTPPDPPSWHEPGVPPSLEATVLRCLASDPAERFPSLHALLRALTEELDEVDALWPSGVEVERRASPRTED